MSILSIYYHSLTSYFLSFLNLKKSYSICTVIIRIIIVLRDSNMINIAKKQCDERYKESWNSPYTWGEFQLPPCIGGAVGGAVGALAPPKAPLCRVGGVRLSPTIPPIQLPPNILFIILYYLPPKDSSPITHSLQPLSPYLFPLYTINH